MAQNKKKYILDMGWRVLLQDWQVIAEDVLRYAGLPPDLLNRKAPTVTASEYFKLWEGISSLMREDPTFPLRLGQSISVEAFSPAIFACFCSPNMNIALSRLQQYKPIVAPLKLELEQNDEQTLVKLAGLPENGLVPSSLIAMELVFMVHLARLATRTPMTPKAVYVNTRLPGIDAYEAFFGVRVTHEDFNGVAFKAADAERPFLTANDAMWSVFEPELRKRLKDLDAEAGFRDRVRASLVEILASGQYSMPDVAYRLAVSTRTLQRRLREEGTSFQQELDDLREELARHYLSNSDYSSAQIAFLLGYQDPNSFFRAFRTWTGQTPEIARADIRGQA
jgi:AraC-like DNA-binding protein